MALLGPLDPSQSQERQRAAMTAQSQHWEDELNKMLREGAVRQNQGFTSPTQVMGQWAQALRGRLGANQAAQNYAALNANLAPGDEPGAAPTAPPAPDTGPLPGGSAEPVAAPPAAGGTPQAKHGGTPFSPEVKQAIIEGSQAAGVDPNEMAMYAHIESDGKPNAHKPGSQYKGLMQLNDDEMTKHSGGQGNVWNPKDATMAAALISKENGAAFERLTGRPSSPFDRYMMHQQGASGYLQHLRNPAGLAVDNMRLAGEKHPHDAITGNGGQVGDTSAQFIGRWRQKFDRMAQGDMSAFQGGQQTAQAPGATPGGAALTGAPGAAAGAPGLSGLVETGRFLDPSQFQQPQSTYSLEQLQRLARSGMLSPEQIDKFNQERIMSQQPREREVPGGKIIFDPRTGQQSYIPTIQTKPVKIGDIETQQMFYLDSKGNRHVIGGASAAGGAPGAPASAPGAPALGGAPDLGHAFDTGDLNEMSQAAIARDAAKTAAQEQAKVAPAIEKKAGETRAEAQEKSFEAARAGFTGMGTNFSLQAPNLRTLTKLAPLAYTGTGADTMLALNRFADKIGLSDRKAAPRELFEQLATRVLADQFSALRNYSEQEGNPAGKVFKSMLDVEEKSNISANDSLPGVLAKLKRMQNVAEKGMHWSDLADEYVLKNKHLDPGFMMKLRKEIANTDYDEGVEFEEPHKPAAGKPGNPPEEGATKTLPNGKTYHFRGGKWHDE